MHSDAAIWTSDAQKNAYLAEAMFFRAFAYRILVSTYGDVPLVTEVIKGAKNRFCQDTKSTGLYTDGRGSSVWYHKPTRTRQGRSPRKSHPGCCMAHAE